MASAVVVLAPADENQQDTVEGIDAPVKERKMFVQLVHLQLMSCHY